MLRLLADASLLLLEIALVVVVFICPWTVALVASVLLLILLGWSWHREGFDARPTG